ncbi:hypothetical protein E8E12_005082 [Didymella heteroderae]|uniref:Uncharacterized protein n=1 Tax=Didymella heteroderae TaxID=1769908 RepID=A0A9P4WPD6_9PLEO|nr:hypothetical protein E8E12_005082 [Didymella heteroderae]
MTAAVSSFPAIVFVSQRIRSSKFYSFSAWTGFFMLLSGAIIMLLALFIEELFELFLRKTDLQSNPRLTYGHAEYQTGSTLQLQHLAHESAGLGTLKRTNNSIHVTEFEYALGILDTSHPGHPSLVRADIEMSRMRGDGETPDAKTGAKYHRLSSNEQI